MKRLLDIYAIMQNIPQIMGLSGMELKHTQSGDKWQGRYYINGQPHPWKKDKLRVWAWNGVVMVGEQGGITISLQKWLVEYGGCVDYYHAYDVLNGSRARMDLDMRLVADDVASKGRYVKEEEYARYRDKYILGDCNLYRYFSRMFGERSAIDIFSRYRVTTDERGNAVYWYIDIDGNICHDKVMRYKFDGHRDKIGGGWRKFTTSDGYVNRCYFGSHLLSERKIGEPVYVVEGEKTAMLCSLIWKGATFLATGGKNQLRDIEPYWVLLPDVDAIDDWCNRGRISRWWENFDDIGDHSDIGDMIENYMRKMEIEYLRNNEIEILQNI